MCLTTSQNPPRCHPSWLSNACSTRMNSVRMAKDNLEINPIKIKPETASHVAEQFSRVLLPYHSPPRHLSNKIFCLVSSCVSLDNSFPSVRQEPSFGPWKGFPFLQQHHQPIKRHHLGTLLGVQWLRIHLSTQAMWVLSLVEELRSRVRGATKPSGCNSDPKLPKI